MSSSVPPTPPDPHQYYSQINSGDLSLPQDLQEQLTKVIDQLQHIKTEAQRPQPNLKNLAANFEQYDHQLTQFLTELNKQSNRGFEKNIKDKFETMHHRFTDELNDIKDTHETSLRDILSSYDPKKLSDFLKGLSQAPGGADNIHHIGQLAGTFSQELSTAFKIQ